MYRQGPSEETIMVMLARNAINKKEMLVCATSTRGNLCLDRCWTQALMTTFLCSLESIAVDYF